ncbi:MAG: hypothetical protein GF408_03865 [Candidatus Omnitrophica bacterium]|nr:hypothetical protein [Candidatus Omnitrophota bacterium]
MNSDTERSKAAMKIADAVRRGEPVYLEPYREPKVWGVEGIGEYWYGAEEGEKSSIAVSGGCRSPFSEVMKICAPEVLGKKVVRSFGARLPLVKILTPKNRLSVQFHDAKNELWVVTGVDREVAWETPAVIIGFSPEKVEAFGSGVTEKYRDALEIYGDRLDALVQTMISSGLEREMERVKNAAVAAENPDASPDVKKALEEFRRAEEELESFYNYRPVGVGDVVAVPSGTLHAAGPGIEIVEPQIPGPTQSLEDGATYPVRYAFPGYASRYPGAGKTLDVERCGEMKPEVAPEDAPEVLNDTEDIKLERLPGNFSDKGLEVNRITLSPGAAYSVSGNGSFHSLVAVEGSADIAVGENKRGIPEAVPGGRMLLVPASAGDYVISSDNGARIIDTFSPVKE